MLDEPGILTEKQSASLALCPSFWLPSACKCIRLYLCQNYTTNLNNLLPAYLLRIAEQRMSLTDVSFRVTKPFRRSSVGLVAIIVSILWSGGSRSLAQAPGPELLPGSQIYEGQNITFKGETYTAISNSTFFAEAGTNAIPGLLGRPTGYQGKRVAVFLDGTLDKDPLDGQTIRQSYYTALDTEVPNNSKGLLGSNGLFDRGFYGGAFAYIKINSDDDRSLLMEKCDPAFLSTRECTVFFVGTIQTASIDTFGCRLFGNECPFLDEDGMLIITDDSNRVISSLWENGEYGLRIFQKLQVFLAP